MFSSTLRRTVVSARPRVAQLTARRTLITLEDHKYTAHATASGQGRNGNVKSDDNVSLELRLALPKSLGGRGDGHNPEQLFAMGYSACFLGALQMVAGQQGKAELARNAKIHAQVHIGKPNGLPGFGLEVELQVEGVSEQALLDAAHEACPYSRALKHGVVVKVTKA